MSYVEGSDVWCACSAAGFHTYCILEFPDVLFEQESEHSIVVCMLIVGIC